MPPRSLLRARHLAALATFLLLVLVPLVASAYYLYFRAEPEYHSDVSFSIRSEDTGAAAAGILGAITGISSGGSAAEPDILFEYIRSQEIVAAIDQEIDLRAIYNRKPDDWVFSLGEGSTVEDLLAHWRRMVDVSFENHSGIIQVRATAFTPEDARAITRAVLGKSAALVNRLAEQARADAIRYAQVDLEEAEAHLRDLRRQMADFRREHQMVDPQADVEGQTGLLTALQEELAKALVERDMLLTYAEPNDQRVQQANRRITAISDRIEDERTTLGAPGNAGKMPELVGDYEALRVDLEFASQAYTQALANLSVARAEARRQSRYLAAHVEPTLAEQALYPRRAMLSGLIGLFLLLGWGVMMLVYYNVRDSR
ncbi:sugar transporter [Amaricoccus sp.]|uniref:sugar transporter n=1 Tax=Amaricoccus sp. TaxID=1872485 RepID=UPI00262BE1E8|nr:sugar transporter [Amaricoccus sp.]HRO12019.1 sugar transporter [Amaricoccus sp.]